MSFYNIVLFLIDEFKVFYFCSQYMSPATFIIKLIRYVSKVHCKYNVLCARVFH